MNRIEWLQLGETKDFKQQIEIEKQILLQGIIDGAITAPTLEQTAILVLRNQAALTTLELVLNLMEQSNQYSKEENYDDENIEVEENYNA